LSVKTNTAAVILAAGKGKRMKSDLPKVLHKLDGKYLVDYVIENARKAGIENIILVIGHKFELVMQELADRQVDFVIQQPQLGTGHAVQVAVPHLDNFDGDLLVLYGDMPFVSSSTIAALIKTRRETRAAATVLTVKLDDPGSYGRIVRDQDGYLEAIVEYKDASSTMRLIKEINTGSYCFDYMQLLPVLELLKSDNAQAEYYLTDTISLLRAKGLKVSALASDNPNEGMGVNSQAELNLMRSIIKEQKH
jgi:UDP-N-acetylglucosamine diphosphorylase/glucosamine-1-phosphate N-acetyltransferase